MNIRKIIKIIVCISACIIMPMHALIQKKIDLFFESKDPHAQLIIEPVEWPVKLVYADTFYGKILRKGVDLFGGQITRQQARSKNRTNPKIVEKQINHHEIIRG